MFQLIESFDQSLLLWLNSFHNNWVDEIMWIISSKWIWIPLYLFIFFKLFKTYQKQFLRIILLIIIVICLSDWISSGVIKNSVKRNRPSHNTEISQNLHLYSFSDGGKYKGGTFGFVSSHAANSFALATLAFLFLRRKSNRWSWLFLWAIIVSYSRIYLGVHYPLDIIGGAMVGVSVASLVYFLSRKMKFFSLP